MYNVIYADPPWEYNNKKTGGGSMVSGSKNKYEVLSIKELCELPINLIADKNSILFLWATVPLLRQAFEVMDAWGFVYKTKITWHKTGRLGIGFWTRGEVEELLLGVKGKITPFRSSIRNHIEHKILKHSEKPEIFREIIEELTSKMVHRRMIELFACHRIDGWKCIGKDIDGMNIKDAIQTMRNDE